MEPSDRTVLTVNSYLHFMLKNPIAIWWAVFVFVVEAVSFLAAPSVMTLTRPVLLVLIFVVLLSTFVGTMVLYRGWLIYSRAFKHIAVRDVVQVDEQQVFLLESPDPMQPGILLELVRSRESVDLPIGVITPIRENREGLVQAAPVWIAPIHIRDLATKEVSIQSLSVRSELSREMLEKWVDAEASDRLQDLMRKGTGR